MPKSESSLYVATLCYGGAAHAGYAHALLALEEACAARALSLRLDLSGGDALVGRGRAAVLARFLASGESHLLMIDPDMAFSPDDVFRMVASDADVAMASLPKGPSGMSRAPSASAGAFEGGLLLVSRTAAQRMSDAYPRLRARLGDVADGAEAAVMVFDSLIEPETGRYLSDLESFCRRWRDLGGSVWAAGALSAHRLA